MLQKEETVMIINTLQFGEIEIDENKILEFKDGLIGFEDCRKFVLISDEEMEPFQWLLCIDEGNEEIGFPLLPPHIFEPNYVKNLPKEVQKKIASETPSPISIFSVVTIKGESGKMTINLRAPIIIDVDRKSGRQLILTSEAIPVDYAIESGE